MFKLKRFISLILIIVLSLSLYININANNKTQITQSSTYATVLEIIDTNALKVSLGDGKIAFIKLNGIKNTNLDKGLEYLTSTVLGEQVMLIKDSYSSFDGMWNYINVFYKGLNLADQLVFNGYAVIDNLQIQNPYNNRILTKNQNIAKEYNLGIWETLNPQYSTIAGGNNNPEIYTKDKVNINTASLYQLKNRLKNITDEVAQNIITYRQKNPFTTIQEIKFVKGFSKDMYSQNKYILSVSTNVLTANDYELQTLGFSSEQITSLNNLINSNSIQKISDLVPTVISSSSYDKLKYFISTQDIDEITLKLPEYTANINASPKSYLEKIGLTSQKSDKIIKYRKNGYTYKTLMELLYLKNSPFVEDELNRYEDNLSILTNLNTSNKNDLIYLFGDYTGIKIYNATFSNKEQLKNYVSNQDYEKYIDAVYVNSFTSEYTNINTASKIQMQNIGFTNDEISKILNARPLLNAENLPFNINRLNSKVSLYTNINKASISELYSLGLSIDDINKITAYRTDQPFGSTKEIKTFFESINRSNIYSNIKNYLVTR